MLTQEQEDLRASLRGFFERYSPEHEVRRLMDTETGHDAQLWKRLSGELGLTGLTVPERFGGSGSAFTDLQVVLEEMGRALVCAPFFSSVVLATSAILESGDDRAAEELLPRIARGELLATGAVAEQDGAWGVERHLARAVRGSEGYLLTGEKRLVLDGGVADVFIVSAETVEGRSLFLVRADAPGVSHRPLNTLDLTRKQSVVSFRSAPAEPLGPLGRATAVLDRVRTLAAAAIAAEQTGGARRVLEMAVDYANVRVQFGRPIGSFQAIKHKCADMLLRVESATSAAYAAGRAIDESADDAALLASLAKAYCSDAYTHAAGENIQVHGGIGFTWEHPAHLYFRRAKSSQLMFGSPGEHRARILQELGA